MFSTKITKEQFIPTNVNRDSQPGKIFACRIWIPGIFFDESEILGFGIQNLAQSIGIWKYYPSPKNLELIQYLKYRMNNMKYRIQDYLGLPYSNYHISFRFEFDFLSGKKEKKSITYCFVLSIWALFSIDRFHPRHGQLQCQFTGTKESVYILKKTVKLAQHILGTLTWPSFHCFGTPIWPP